MSNDPLVSVLMTAFNRQKYIGEAIQSVLKSTYANWELIVVDDLSTDNTISIARQYEEKDTRIKVYVNEQNLGDYPNRNKAASFATGKYLKYVDADDCIYQYGLEIMVKNMESFPEAGWGLMSLKPHETKMYPILLMPYEAYFQNYLMNDPFTNPHKLFSKAPLSAIIKRAVFEESGGFNNVRHFGDGDLWNRLARKYPLVIMQEGVVWYRRHGDQEQGKRKTNFVVKIRGWNNIIEHLEHPDCPLPIESVVQLIKRIHKLQTRIIVKSVLKAKSLSTLRSLRDELKLKSIR